MYDATVYKQWGSRPADQRFETMAELTAQVQQRRETARETLAYTGELRYGLDTAGELAISAAGLGPVVPTHWALTQLCRAISAPSDYLRRLPPKLATECLTATTGGRQNIPLKLYAGDSELRALTSPSYGRIYDIDAVNLVNSLVERSEGAFYNPPEWSGRPGGLYASDSDCFMFMVDGGSIVEGKGPRDKLFRGFYVSNSEVGKASFNLKSFLFQEVCGNYQIWGQSDVKAVRLRHTARAPHRYANEFWALVLEWMKESPEGEATMIEKAKTIELPSDDLKRIDWVTNRGFTKTEASVAINLAETEIGECKNIWQLVDGLTMSARTIANIDRKHDLEIRAGQLMKLAA